MKDEDDYTFPEKIELDDEAFEELSGELRRPRAPSKRLRDLLKKHPIQDIKDELAAARARRAAAQVSTEEADILAGKKPLPRKYRAYDVIMVVIFLAALAALVIVLGACGGGQKCWTASSPDIEHATSPTGGSGGGEKSCRSKQ